MTHRPMERRHARLRRASFGLCTLLSLASASDAAGQPSAPEQRLREALGWSSFTPARPIAEPRTTGPAGGLVMMHVWLKSPPGGARTELLGVQPLRRGRSVVAPMAAVGDSVTAFLGGRAMRIPVLARVPARQTFIGGVCVRTGWTYLLGRRTPPSPSFGACSGGLTVWRCGGPRVRAEWRRHPPRSNTPTGRRCSGLTRPG
jgi:hypothetical protein